MEMKDLAAVTNVLGQYLSKFALSPLLSEEDVKHWVMPRDDVVYSFVVEDASKEIQDVVSFYSLVSGALTMCIGV